LPSDLALLVARCRDATGDPHGAIASPVEVVDRAADAATRAEAQWLATAVGVRAGIPVPERALSPGAPWAELAREELRQATFLARLGEWRGSQPLVGPSIPKR